jgi:hypothetical protein
MCADVGFAVWQGKEEKLFPLNPEAYVMFLVSIFDLANLQHMSYPNVLPQYPHV